MLQLRPLAKEVSIRTPEDRFRTVFTFASDAIFLIDPWEDRILDANPAACQLLGYTREELLLLPVSIVHANEMPELLAFARAVSTYGQGSAQGLKCRHKSGKMIAVDISAAAFFMVEENIHLIFVARDKAEHKNSGSTGVGWREEEQLRYAHMMHVLGRVAAAVASDYIDKLQAVRGYADLLLSEIPETDPHRTNLLSIINVVAQATDVVRHLLSFANDKGGLPLRVDLTKLVVDARQLLHAIAGGLIQLTVETLPHPLFVYADPVQLKQLLINLVANARDAIAHTGNISIQVEGTSVDSPFAREHSVLQPGAYAVLRVRDSGSGIPSEVRERMFEPFYTTKASAKALGLGLTIVRKIVHLARGAVYVESEVGRGSCFEVYWPLAVEVQSGGSRHA